MLDHLLDSLAALAPARTVVVAGDRFEQLESALAGRGIDLARQEPQLGTAHAALMARDALRGFEGDVLVCFGDCPMLKAATVLRMTAELERGATVAALGFRPRDTLAYGRIIADADGRVAKMVEHKDAREAEREVALCNAGLIVALSTDAPIGLVSEDFAPARWLGLIGFVGAIVWLYGWMLRKSRAAT